MSTRSTILFKDDDEEYYIYRHSDGHPGIVIGDLERVY